MIEIVPVSEAIGLADYASHAYLAHAVGALKAEAASLVPRLAGRKLWMINSTAAGGGVAEMLPRLVSILRELGVATEWAVMGTDDEAFFRLTKHIHNLVHGSGNPLLEGNDRALYEQVNRENADQLKQLVGATDVLAVHDPQPAAMGAMLKRELELPAIWRCHIGLDERTPATAVAWRFLRPYVEVYDRAIFSVPEYIPGYLAGRSSIIYPGIDPLSQKNRDLHPHKLTGILCNAGLARDHHPVVTPAFDNLAQRLRPDGTFGPACNPNGVGFLFRPIVTEVSRWDRLKGFAPLMEGFARLKRRLERDDLTAVEPRHLRRLRTARLVLAGPDPSSIQDDPEGIEVLDELKRAYRALEPKMQEDIALLSLPMASRKENALMVNVLQRCSTIVVQNSLREGFGLTITEAMWKRAAVLGTPACGLRAQIRDRFDGRRVSSAEDPDEIAETLDEMLADPVRRDLYGRNAQRHVYEDFLVLAQVRNWLTTLVSVVERSTASA
jgi:trehalose synthase